MEDDRYHAGEEIRVRLGLQNTSRDDVLFQSRMVINSCATEPGERDVCFVITSPSGKTIEFDTLSRVRLINSSDFRDVNSGEELSATYALTTYYSPFDEIGIYTIQGIYENRSDPGDGRIAWKGKLTSDTVTFTLEP
jgi:hypothetical protein